MPRSPETAPAAARTPETTVARTSAAPRRARFVRGLKLGFPIFLGYVPVGMAFAILARGLGFSVVAATVCSATALAGAGQFIALSLLGGGATAFEVLAATTVVNLRYVLFGSTISPYLRGVPLTTQAALAFSLTDETFAVNIADQRAGLSTPATMLGVGTVAWTGWVTGTLIGAIGASWIGDPTRFGVGFAMPAMFTALFIELADDRRHIIIGALAGAIALCLPLLQHIGVTLSSSWFIIIASMTAATIGSVVWREG